MSYTKWKSLEEYIDLKTRVLITQVLHKTNHTSRAQCRESALLLYEAIFTRKIPEIEQ